MLEYLPLFAVVVLVVHVTATASTTSAIGAQLFFYARLVYTVVYLIGIPGLRTAVWAVSIVGLILVAVPILSALGGA